MDEISPIVPSNDYLSFFESDFTLTHLIRKVPVAQRPANLNTKEYLQTCKNTILKNLSCLRSAPSVQMREIPPDSALREAVENAAPSTKGVRDDAQ